MIFIVHEDCCSTRIIILSPTRKPRSLYIPFMSTFLIVISISPSSVVSVSSGWSARYSCIRYFLSWKSVVNTLSFTVYFANAPCFSSVFSFNSSCAIPPCTIPPQFRPPPFSLAGYLCPVCYGFIIQRNSLLFKTYLMGFCLIRYISYYDAIFFIIINKKEASGNTYQTLPSFLISVYAPYLLLLPSAVRAFRSASRFPPASAAVFSKRMPCHCSFYSYFCSRQ